MIEDWSVYSQGIATIVVNFVLDAISVWPPKENFQPIWRFRWNFSDLHFEKKFKKIEIYICIKNAAASKEIKKIESRQQAKKKAYNGRPAAPAHSHAPTASQEKKKNTPEPTTNRSPLPIPAPIYFQQNEEEEEEDQRST